MRTANISSVIAVLLIGGGCAQGSSGGPDDSGTGGIDTGTVRRDTGTTNRDTGTMPTCTDEGHGAMCESATDLGSLAVGDMMMTMPGVLPQAGDEDWFRVDFPPSEEMNTPGGGTPSIELTMNDGEAFRFEVRGSCTETLGCGDGMSARDIDTWTFVDDRSDAGVTQWSTRDVPWPGAAVIRVYRPVGSGDCQRYQLRVSR